MDLNNWDPKGLYEESYATLKANSSKADAIESFLRDDGIYDEFDKEFGD